MIQMIEAMLQICGIKEKMIDKFSLVLFMEAWRHAQTKNFMKTMGPNLLDQDLESWARNMCKIFSLVP